MHSFAAHVCLAQGEADASASKLNDLQRSHMVCCRVQSVELQHSGDLCHGQPVAAADQQETAGISASGVLLSALRQYSLPAQGEDERLAAAQALEASG